MSTALHPVTDQRLHQFARRRNLLLWLRGISCVVLVFLVGILIVASIDSLWVLEDRVRIGLSLALYATAAATWWFYLRPSVRQQPREEAARTIESLDHRLHERLLPAVELADESSDRHLGSPTFRRLLQEQVAALMSDVDVRRLLPSRMIQRSLWLAILSIVLCVVLLLIPGSQWPQRFMRALFPHLNLARVSQVQVHVLQPSPASTQVPQDETIAIEVEVLSEKEVPVWLETYSATAGTVKIPMRPSAEHQFLTTLPIEQEVIEYRVFAGDAITERYQLTPRPRPWVKSFKKTFTYPKYTQLANKTIEEDQGDLRALAGTQTEVVFEIDQTVREASIELTVSGSVESKVIDLEQIDDLHWKGSLALVRPAEYKVHLVAEATGFDNPLSPKYAIDPIPDQPPQLQLANLSSAQSLVPADETLHLRGHVEDELPVSTLEQWVSINEGRWEHLPRLIPEEAKSDSEWDWDLLQHRLAVGDRVRTKLVAVDRKGQRAESVPLELLITAQEFDPDRHRMVALRAQLLPLVNKYAEEFTQAQNDAKPMLEQIQKQLQKPTEKDAKPDLKPREDFAKRIVALVESTKALRAKTAEVIQQLTDPSDIEELEFMARVLSRSDQHWLAQSQALVDEAWPASDQNQRQHDFNMMQQGINEATESARQVAQRYRLSFMHDLSTAIALDAHALLAHQKQADSPEIHDSVVRLNRHQTVLSRQLQACNKLVMSFRNDAQDDMRGYFDNWQNWFTQRAVMLEKSLLEPDTEPGKNSLSQLQNTHHQITQDLAELEKSPLQFRWQLPDTRRIWEQRGGVLFQDLHAFAQGAQQFLEHQRQGGSQDTTGDSQKVLLKGQRLWRELVELQQPKIAQIATRRVTLQANAVSDPGLVSDLGLAERALQAVMKQMQAPGSAANSCDKDLRTIAEAFAVLEAGHEIVEAQRRLITLVNDERWNSQKFASRFEHPRRWMIITQQWETGSRLLREARLNEIADGVDRVRWFRSAGEANQKFESRYDRREWPSTHDELQAVNQELPPVMTKLAAEMEAARRKLAELAPTIADLAKQAAQELRELNEATEKMAEEAKQAEAPVAQSEEMQQKVDEATEKLEKFVEALVQEANTRELTNAAERAAAQVADQQLAQVEAEARPMREAMQDAAEAERPKEQAAQLEQAAEHQAKLAETLDKIAAQAENPDEAQAADPAALANAQNPESALDDPQALEKLQQQYQQAERLEKLANVDAQEMLRKLEEELQKNPQMQEALSEISQQAATEALATLHQAEQREARLQQMIEQGDAVLSEKKRDLAEDLRELASSTQQLASHLMAPSRDLANQAKANEAAQQLQDALTKAQQQISEAQHVRSDQTVQELQEKAESLAQELRNAAETAQKAAEELAKAEQNPVANQNDKQRTEQKKSLERKQNELQAELARSAERRVRESEEKKNKAENSAKTAGKKLNDAEKDLEKAKQSQDREPKKPELAQRVAELDRKVQEAKQLKEIAEQHQQEAQQSLDQKRQAFEAAKSAPAPELNSQNPAAELAKRWSEKAAEAAKQLADQADKLSQDKAIESQLTPRTDTLAEAAQQQQEVTRDVQQAAEDVQRASRHEQRLGNEPGAKQLAEQGASIEKTTQQDVAPAGEKLRQAAQTKEGQPGNKPAENQPSLEARAATEQAEQALAREAGSLEAMLAQQPASSANNADANSPNANNEATPPNADSQTPSPQGQANASQSPPADGNATPPEGNQTAAAGQNTPPASGQPNAQSKSGSPDPGAQQRAQLMAQLLDELDRQMQQSPANANSPSNPPSSTLSAAAEALAQAAREQRQKLQQSATEGPPQQESMTANVNPVPTGEFGLLRVDRRGGDWGKLREQSAEDLTEGNREEMAPEYRRSLEVYYRVLSERARKKP